MPEELWTEVRDIVQAAVTNTIPKKKKCRKAEWLSEEGLQIAEKRREAKSKGEKERYTHPYAVFHTIAGREKSIPQRSMQRKRGMLNRMGKTGDLFKKIRDIKGTFHAKIGTIKDRNVMDLT